jgi:hypothetical protein
MTDHATTRTQTASWSRTEWWPVVAFSAIGLLVTLNMILRFPEWGAVIAQYNQF